MAYIFFRHAAPKAPGNPKRRSRETTLRGARQSSRLRSYMCGCAHPRDSQACFRFFFSIFSPVFQQLLFIFPDLNFLLSTIYFSREILLTNTLEKNLIQIISSIVLRICMMKLYSYPAFFYFWKFIICKYKFLV